MPVPRLKIKRGFGKRAEPVSGSFRIEVGATVIADGNPAIIVALLSLQEVLVREKATGNTHRVSMDRLKPASSTPGETVKQVERFDGASDKDWDEALRRFACIKGLLSLNLETWEVDQQVASAGVHRTTLYRWVRLYREGGNRISALLPTKPLGGQGGSRLDCQVEDLIAEALRTLYLSPQKRRISAVWREITIRCKEQNLPPPAYNTVLLRVKRLPTYDRVRSRIGAKEAREASELHKGRFETPQFPLEFVQIDHTPLDLVLVDEVTRLPIGRPWLTLAIDVYSRMVVGYYLSFDPPGALSVGLCLVHGILPKETWLAKNNVDSPWPCYGVPHTIHADNGKDFRSHTLKRSCQENGINIEWRPLGQPNYGGHIERLLGTFLREIHNLPGTTFSSIAERGNYDSARHSAFTLRECEVWLASYITGVYHQRPHSGINGQCPLKRYEEGILGSQTKPGCGLPPLVTDEHRLYLDFLPGVERNIQEYGVQIDNITYFSDDLRPHVVVVDPEHPMRKAKFLFKRDPRDISVIYFLIPTTKSYCPIPYRNPAYPAISIWELKEAQRKIRELHNGSL